MLSEGESKIIQSAEKIMVSSSHHRGLTYLKSPYKRALDILMTGPSAPLYFPAIALCGLAVLCADGPPVFVNIKTIDQEAGLMIPKHKIRSMVHKALELDEKITGGKSITEFKTSGEVDPRVTRVGWILRKTSLDELPQLLDVLMGKLSFVGPRPLGQYDWKKILLDNSTVSPYKEILQYLRSGAKCGIVSLPIIFGREKLSLEMKLLLNLLYFNNATLIADLRIIALSLPAGLSGRGVS